MRKLYSMKTSLVLCIAIVLFSACSKNNNDNSLSGETTLNVYLTDDPSPYDAVNIDIQSIEVHFSSDSSEDTWHTLHMVDPGAHNLLRFTNGKDTLLASDRLAAHEITQIRLILGTNNTIEVGGVSFPLETPSAQESGIKLNVDAQLTAGIEYKIWTDFDAARSIVTTGNGKFILKPVIRVYTKAISGSVKGIVLPDESNPWVYAINGSDTVASAKPDSLSGSFLIDGLAAGTYSLAVDGNNNYNDTTYTNVDVTTGATTDIGTVQLHQ